MLFFFFFKQKTAYEMRISDWSSDVCSSDLTAVLEAMDKVYRTGYANVHRGAYYFSQHLTDRYEGVRAKVARFLNAGSEKEIVFTRNVKIGRASCRERVCQYV